MMDEGSIKSAQKQGKIRKGSTVVINTSESPSAFSSLTDCNVTTIDANRIAVEKGLTLPSGMPIINTTVLGALWGLLPSVAFDHLAEALREGKLPVVEKNIEAAREANEIIKRVHEVPEAEKVTAVEAAPVVAEQGPQFLNRMAPCGAACPAGENIERTAYFIENQRFEEALESIKSENPFPGTCGRACFHPCEASCNRIQYDEGVATNALERAAFDYADSSRVKKPEKRPPTGKKVAVIGSGPAGMTAAYFLSLLGHKVTVFEALPIAGGAPRFGIPERRLPKNVVDREIKEIADLGVDIRVNTKIGKDIAFEELTKEHDACLIAAGGRRSVLGETLELPFPDGTVEMSGSAINVDQLGRTSITGVYAAGDLAKLSRSVVEAIASGKRAALGIDLFLTNGDEKVAASFFEGKSGAVSMSRYLAGDDTSEGDGLVSFEDLNVAYFTKAPRQVMAKLSPEKRELKSDETNLGFTRDEAIAEARRCFHCGHCIFCENCYILCPDLAISLDSNGLSFTINKKVCKSCGICIHECPRNAISWKGVA
ncbi:Ferredoxin--NADP reductase [subsurface metagenome]